MIDRTEFQILDSKMNEILRHNFEVENLMRDLRHEVRLLGDLVSVGYARPDGDRGPKRGT